MLSTFIKLPFVIKIFVLSIFEWPFYTGFTIASHDQLHPGEQFWPIWASGSYGDLRLT